MKNKVTDLNSTVVDFILNNTHILSYFERFENDSDMLEDKLEEFCSEMDAILEELAEELDQEEEEEGEDEF